MDKATLVDALDELIDGIETVLEALEVLRNEIEVDPAIPKELLPEILKQP